MIHLSFFYDIIQTFINQWVKKLALLDGVEINLEFMGGPCALKRAGCILRAGEFKH
jgi:hypothetical protein